MMTMKSNLFVFKCQCGIKLKAGEHELMFLDGERQQDKSPIKLVCPTCGRQHDFTMTINYDSVYTPSTKPVEKVIYKLSEVREAAIVLGVKLLKEQQDKYGYCSFDDMCTAVWDYLQQNTNAKDVLSRRVQQLFRDAYAEYYHKYEEKQ
jgi:DNA-directed RNA polymerase subunit M/transcription elongation factor TFIIS